MTQNDMSGQTVRPYGRVRTILALPFRFTTSRTVDLKTVLILVVIKTSRALNLAI